MNRSRMSPFEIYFYGIGAGVAWAAAFVLCAVAAVALIAVLADAKLEDVFSLTGSAGALIAKYSALALLTAIVGAAIAASFVATGNLVSARDGFSDDRDWIDAAPSWLRWWERSVAGPVRRFMGRSTAS